jgi:dipeptidyl aminopeptidase/acylaminoacyl peptidase
MRLFRPLAPAFFGLLFASAALHATARSTFTMAQILHYPYATELASASQGDAIAWVRDVDGIRNVWLAHGPDFAPVQLTRYTEDDGQEITQLTFSPDGTRLVYVRGGDHDANWPAEGNLAPDPSDSPEQPLVTVWTVPLTGGTPVKLAEGDTPAISSDGQLRWSPDGSHLAFVSNRGDHSFIGIFTAKDQPIVYVAPSTGRDSVPRWSPDGQLIAFVRQPGRGGPPEPLLQQTPHPWAIWVGKSDGTGHAAWQSPNTLPGSHPDEDLFDSMNWGAGDRLVFLAYLDDWPHLYSVPAAGGSAPTLLTPGAFMVERFVVSRDRKFVIYAANTGTTAGDHDRRHLFKVPVERPAPEALTSGDTLEWRPVAASAQTVAFVSSGYQQPPAVAVVGLDGKHRSILAAGPVSADFPLSSLVAPKPVTFNAADGLVVHGQLFEAGAPAARGATKPAIIFVHGGPPRQMLLGWHYMQYYSNAYAVNQYLANRGFIVLSVNYRLGIGYGRAFHEPDHAGPAGSSEYQDVVAGAHYLQTLAGVDPKRIGIWGGSYGGLLTALALARNSDIFAAGVDLHGVHDWSRLMDELAGKAETRYEKGDREAAMKVAWESSPTASVDNWKSPVLLIQGDDDRNVPFQQTVDLVRRLREHEVPLEELVIPNEIHGFLRAATWLRVDQATAEFFARTFKVPPQN